MSNKPFEVHPAILYGCVSTGRGGWVGGESQLYRAFFLGGVRNVPQVGMILGGSPPRDRLQGQN